MNFLIRVFYRNDLHYPVISSFRKIKKRPTAVHCAVISVPFLLSIAWLHSTSAAFHSFGAFPLQFPSAAVQAKASRKDIPTVYRHVGKLQTERSKMLYRTTHTICSSDHLFFLFRHFLIPISDADEYALDFIHKKHFWHIYPSWINVLPFEW